MASAERKQEFKENRISWKWLDKKVQKLFSGEQTMGVNEIALMVGVEILKELQYLNDK